MKESSSKFVSSLMRIDPAGEKRREKIIKYGFFSNNPRCAFQTTTKQAEINEKIR